jgi:tetratricopeptide (TPR) repeat protein
MLCNQSESTVSVVWRRVFPAVLLYLNATLLISCPPVHAQAAEPEQNGSISGIVYSQTDNQPATQVAVTIKSHEAGIYRSVLTDYEGRFEVSGLARGMYEIRVEESGYEPLQTTAQVDGSPAKVELHLISSSPALRNKYTISVRELAIPGKAHEEFDRGIQSLDKKDFASSLSHFTKAVQKFPGYFEAVYHLGVVHTSLGQLEKAMQAFQKCLELSGGRYARADFGIGYLLYLQGKPGEAEGVIRRGLELDSNSPDGYVVLGMAQLRLDQPAEAEKSAREALLRNPNLANAYLVLADSFAQRQDYREQIQGLDSYLALEPTGQMSQRVQKARELAQKFLDRPQSQN